MKNCRRGSSLNLLCEASKRSVTDTPSSFALLVSMAMLKHFYCVFAVSSRHSTVNEGCCLGQCSHFQDFTVILLSALVSGRICKGSDYTSYIYIYDVNISCNCTSYNNPEFLVYGCVCFYTVFLTPCIMCSLIGRVMTFFLYGSLCAIQTEFISLNHLDKAFAQSLD